MNIDLHGFRDADKLLAQYSGSELNDKLRPAMERSLELVRGEMADYPPPPPGSTYIRGGPRSEKLGQRWTTARPVISNISGGLEGKIGNNASYAPWVQNRQFQARVHQGRWQTDEDVLERNERRIRQEFEDALRR